MTPSIAIRPVLFVGKESCGDFAYMAPRPEYANCVFLICENYMDMLFCNENGAGTATLRKRTWPLSKSPCAVGIPTGWSVETGGFRVLVDSIRRLIDLAIDRVIAHLIEHPNVDTVIYSADPTDNAQMGVGIFQATLSQAVREYISTAIHDIPRRHANALAASDFPTMEQLREAEILLPVPAFTFAQVIHERDVLARTVAQLRKNLNASSSTEADVRRKRPATTQAGIGASEPRPNTWFFNKQC